MKNNSTDLLALRAVSRFGESLLLSWLKSNPTKFALDLRDAPDHAPQLSLGASTQWGQWTPSSADAGRLALTAEGEAAFKEAYGIEARFLSLLGSANSDFVVVDEEVRGNTIVRRLRPLIYTVDGGSKRCLIFNLANSSSMKPSHTRAWLHTLKEWLKTTRLPGRLGTGFEAKQRLWEAGLRQKASKSLWSNS